MGWFTRSSNNSTGTNNAESLCETAKTLLENSPESPQALREVCELLKQSANQGYALAQCEKVATTIDSHLFELVKQRQQAGQQLSHILDSALWNYFGRPKLSFESDDKE